MDKANKPPASTREAKAESYDKTMCAHLLCSQHQQKQTMIESTKSYKTSNGAVYLTVEEAQIAATATTEPVKE